MMEKDEPPPVVSATPKAGPILKEKKKKLKAVFRKRHLGLGNLSIRNSTLNSTIFKTSLKINNRALAQALERKKGECRAAEAIILQQQETIQLLTAEVNKAKMLAEKPRHAIEECLQAVSKTMQLAVQQLCEAMDACTDGEFRKRSGHLFQPTTTSTSVVPSNNEQISQKPSSDVVVRPARGPSRVAVSAAAAAAACDDDDEDQDVITSMDPGKEPSPPSDGPNLPASVASSNLSIIMEQSYMVPCETDFPFDEPVLGYKRSYSKERRNMVVFQPSSVDSPVPAEEENLKQEGWVRRSTRSRSRQFDLPSGEMDMPQEAGVTRSKSRDRRNAMIFHPSSADNSPDEEDRVSAGNCVRILRRSRNRSGQFPEASTLKSGRFEECHPSSESIKFKDSVAIRAEVNRVSGGSSSEADEQCSLDETIITGETEVLSSEQLSHLQSLVKNSGINEGNDHADGSMDLVEETIIIPSEETTSCITETVMEVDSSRLSLGEEKKSPSKEISMGVRKHIEQVGEGLTGSKVSHKLKQNSVVPDSSAVEEANGLVNRGQFMTRDKIARTPVKAAKHFHEGEDNSADNMFRQSGNLSEILDRESNESEYRRSRSLSRRDIPTFLPIDSPNASGTTNGVSKRRLSAPKGQGKGSTFLRKKGTKEDGVGPSELKEKKRQNNPVLISCQATVSEGNVICSAVASTENSLATRRQTFAIPNCHFLFPEADIMKEDDSILISESDENWLGSQNDVFIDADQPPSDEGIYTGSSQVASQHVDQPPPNQPSTQNGLPEKNATILMAEDMEQTGISFTAISVSDPPANVGQLADGEANSVKNSKVQNGNSVFPERQQVGLDELAGGEKKSQPIMSCAESIRGKPNGKHRKVNNTETTDCNETEASVKTAEEDVEPTHNLVKRRRVAKSKLKLPGSAVAVVEASSDLDTGSRPGTAATKGGTVIDNAVQSLANNNHESECEESHEQSIDVELKKRFAAYLSKPGSIVFNADRKDATGSEVAKPTRSKSRSILPLQQKPRSKVTCAKPENEGTSSSVWDFRGTPRLAAAKENADRLLSVYDISLNDSGVIPKPTTEPVPVPGQKKRSKAPTEFSKDDSFIVDKKPLAGKRRVRHESASATVASKSKDAPTGASVSPHGILLVLGNGKRIKPSARSKTVRYDVAHAGQNKIDADPTKTNSLLPEISQDSASAADSSQPALKTIDLISELKPALAETAVAVKNPEEPSTQQLEINHEKLTADLAKEDAQEKAERISVKDVHPECGKSKEDGISHSVKDIKNPENNKSKEIIKRNRACQGTVKNKDNVIAVPDKDAADNVKGSNAGKKGRCSVSSKGRTTVNPRKEIRKDSTDSLKGSKNVDSKGCANFSSLNRDDVTNIETASSRAFKNFDNDQATVLSANKLLTSKSDRAGDSAPLHDLLASHKPTEVEEVVSEQLAEPPKVADSPRPVQRKARKRRVMQSSDLFEDIDTLRSPKSKQPAVVDVGLRPGTSAGPTETRLKPDNHRQPDGPTTRRSQSDAELPKPGNVCKDHNSLRLPKNPKATATKTQESSDVREVAQRLQEAVFRQLVSDQPVPEKKSDTKKTSSSEKNSPAVPPRRRTNLSLKNVKEKTSQRKSNLPKDDILEGVDTVHASSDLVEASKDLDLQDDRGHDGKLKKKRSVIQNRQSSASNGSCDTSSHSEMGERRTRRNAAQAVSYKEPSLGKKLRRGDPHTSTIYAGADSDLAKHRGSERTSNARLSRKVLSTMENTSMETE